MEIIKKIDHAIISALLLFLLVTAKKTPPATTITTLVIYCSRESVVNTRSNRRLGERVHFYSALPLIMEDFQIPKTFYYTHNDTNVPYSHKLGGSVYVDSRRISFPVRKLLSTL